MSRPLRPPRGGQKDKNVRAGQKGTEEEKGMKMHVLQPSEPLAGLLAAGRASEEEKIGPRSSSLWFLPCVWTVGKAKSTARTRWHRQKLRRHLRRRHRGKAAGQLS